MVIDLTRSFEMNLISVVNEDSGKFHRTLGNEKTFILWNLAVKLILQLLGKIMLYFLFHSGFRMLYYQYFITCECIITDLCRCASESRRVKCCFLAKQTHTTKF